MNFKNRYPFRIGCTSYVLPDEILPNIACMADRVDDIELVLFESGDGSNLPGKAAVASMQHLADEHDITYSVHFPIDCRAGAGNPEEREKFLRCMTGIVSSTRDLPVSGYLLHLEGLADENDPREVRRWNGAVEELCRKASAVFREIHTKICIENLGYPPRLHARLVEEQGFSHCVDLGHLWMQQGNWREYLNQVLDKTAIIHLHGVENGTDHRSLKLHTRQEQLQELMLILRKYTGVVTLEVFSEDDTFSSLAYFEEVWHQSH